MTTVDYEELVRQVLATLPESDLEFTVKEFDTGAAVAICADWPGGRLCVRIAHHELERYHYSVIKSRIHQLLEVIGRRRAG